MLQSKLAIRKNSIWRQLP